MKRYITATESESVKGMIWYTWQEICDGCGKIIYNKNDIRTTKKPNMDEKDYCIDCLRNQCDYRETIGLNTLRN